MSPTEFISTYFYVLMIIVFGACCVLGRLAYREKVFAIMFYGMLWALVALSLLGGGFLSFLQFLPTKNPAALAAVMPLGVGMLAVGCFGTLIMFRAVRKWLSTWMPLNPDSPLHQFGLIITLPFIAILFCTTLMSTPEKLLELMQHANILLGTFYMQAYLVAITFCGVGWGYVRDWEGTRQRLGLKPISLKEVGMAIGIAVGMFVFLSFVLDPLLRQFLPSDRAFQEEIMRLSRPGKETGNPLLEIFLLSVMAGTGEELFFRGLALPVIGLIPSAVLFALIHIQYGFSTAIIVVLCSGLLLGWLRQRFSTTFAIVVHITYDILAFAAATYLMKPAS